MGTDSLWGSAICRVRITVLYLQWDFKDLFFPHLFSAGIHIIFNGYFPQENVDFTFFGGKKKLSENKDEFLFQVAWRSVCACLSCHYAQYEFFVKHLKFLLPAAGGPWLMAAGAWATQAAVLWRHKQRQAETKCCKWHFFSKIFAPEKNSSFQLLTLRLKALMEFILFFLFSHSWGKGGDGRERT